MAAAEGAGAERFLAQSVAWELTGAGGAAKEELERAVLGFGGVVLRYGRFYGCGTYHAEPPDPPRIQIDQAARRTAGLLDAPSGIVEVVQVDVQAGLKPWRSGSARCSPADSRRPRSGTARLRLPRSGGVAAPPAESRLRGSASSSA